MTINIFLCALFPLLVCSMDLDSTVKECDSKKKHYFLKIPSSNFECYSLKRGYSTLAVYILSARCRQMMIHFCEYNEIRCSVRYTYSGKKKGFFSFVSLEYSLISWGYNVIMFP